MTITARNILCLSLVIAMTACGKKKSGGEESIQITNEASGRLFATWVGGDRLKVDLSEAPQPKTAEAGKVPSCDMPFPKGQQFIQVTVSGNGEAVFKTDDGITLKARKDGKVNGQDTLDKLYGSWSLREADSPNKQIDTTKVKIEKTAEFHQVRITWKKKCSQTVKKDKK